MTSPVTPPGRRTRPLRDAETSGSGHEDGHHGMGGQQDARVVVEQAHRAQVATARAAASSSTPVA